VCQSAENKQLLHFFISGKPLKTDVTNIVSSELNRIANDPELQHLIKTRRIAEKILACSQ
jgi:hypothetical protein